MEGKKLRNPILGHSQSTFSTMVEPISDQRQGRAGQGMRRSPFRFEASKRRKNRCFP